MSAALDISAELQRQSISGIMAQMHRASSAVGKSLGQSTQLTAWAVADALRVATNISLKKRPVREIGADIVDRKKIFEVEGYKRGRKFTFQMRAADKREAMASKRVKILNTGLAAKSWHWPQSKLGSSRGGKQVSAYTKDLAEKYSSVTAHLSGENPSVLIENKLPYATEAFKASGDQTVSNVMERAAKRMAHIIDGQIARKFGI